MKHVVVAALSFSFLVACGGGEQTRAQKVAALTASTTAGKDIYTQTCAACHGADGKGNATYPSVTQENEAEEIAQTLINGVPGTDMASYASFTDQQLADVTAYVKSL